MTRTTPGIDRAVLVLNLLAEHPTEELSLSEIARCLDLPKATGHAVLTSLVIAGFALRNPSRSTYRLGPALIGLGRAAEEGFVAVDYARDEMRVLASRFHVDCVATAAVGDEVVVLARAGGDSPLTISLKIGHRLPLVPPLGTVFFAWSSSDDVDAWLHRVRPTGPGRSLDLDRYRAAIEVVPRRGCALRLTPSPGSPAAETGDSILLELGAADRSTVNYVVAPVFGPDRDVVMALTLVGLPEQLGVDDVDAVIQELRAAAHRVTVAIRGREPQGLA